MSPTAVPTRITIDFRDSMHPSRNWILGLDADPAVRVDLLAFDGAGAATSTRPSSRPVPSRPTALSAECSCPDFCERDHENE